MKILLLTPDLPYPAESGAAIRNLGVIRGLRAAGHCITLLSFADKSVDPDANPLFDLCEAVHAVPLPDHGKLKRIVTLLSSDKADMEFRLASEQFKQMLMMILQNGEFDLIQFSGIELGSYLPLITSCSKQAKVLYDALNAEAELQRVIAQVDRADMRRLPAAIYSAIQSVRLARFEKAICKGVDAVIVVSEEDRDFLKSHGGAPTYLMSNGIDVADYRPPPDSKREACQLVFSGKMDYRPNVDAIEWFHDDVLPRVRSRYPQVSLLIVGRNPHPRLEPLAADGKIRITGWVQSVQPYLHAATIYVVPLRMGSGTRLKILQAMAAGCAVVSTSIGAAGLNEEVRSALEIADDAESFARTIVSLLDDERRRLELGTRAVQQVSQHYDWSALIPLLLQTYEELGIG